MIPDYHQSSHTPTFWNQKPRFYYFPLLSRCFCLLYIHSLWSNHQISTHHPSFFLFLASSCHLSVSVLPVPPFWWLEPSRWSWERHDVVSLLSKEWAGLHSSLGWINHLFYILGQKKEMEWPQPAESKFKFLFFLLIFIIESKFLYCYLKHVLTI